jgi:hypothetical protein
MPSLRVAFERLKYEMDHGNGEEIVHVSFVEREQKERIKNNKRVTRFVLPCDDPDLCSRMNAHKDRIYRKVRDKSLMLTLMERAWSEALSDAELDKIVAALEGPEVA